MITYFIISSKGPRQARFFSLTANRPAFYKTPYRRLWLIEKGTILTYSLLVTLLLNQHESMSLNSHDSEAFFNALAKPVRFNNALSAAFEEYHQRVTSK